MAAIIRVRDENGNVIDIPAIVGDPGEKGDPGANSANGEDGYTPLRGTDYWTEAGRAEIKSYVDNALSDLVGLYVEAV